MTPRPSPSRVTRFSSAVLTRRWLPGITRRQSSSYNAAFHWVAKFGFINSCNSSSGVASGLIISPFSTIFRISSLTLSRCQLKENGIWRGFTSKLNSSNCRSSSSAPIISHIVASSLGQVYQSMKRGSCISGWSRCCTPQISCLSGGNGGNCLPTARTYFHRSGSCGPALARISTRWQASLKSVSQGSSSNPST